MPLFEDVVPAARHDRGGRVAHRMALDRPETVRRMVVMDIVPTGEVWAGVTNGPGRAVLQVNHREKGAPWSRSA
jgi:pimeloyl-ACP methyl ester carboxylesterase